MFYLLNWFLVLSLVALWSLTAWGLHALAVWTVSNAGAFTGAATDAAAGVGGLQLPAWLAPWVPPEVMLGLTALLAGMGPAIDSVLQAAPALAGGLTVITWAIWGIGTALLLLLGAGLHLLIAVLRRRSGGGGPPQRPPVAA